MLTPLQRSRTATPVPLQEAKPITAPAPAVDIERRVTALGTTTIARARYTVGSAYAGRIVTARIDASVVQCILDGRIVRTLPRRHLGDIVPPSADKKHASRRAADARRRAMLSGEVG